MASASDAAPAESALPAMPQVPPMLNFVPSADDLVAYEWKGVDLSIPTSEFGEAWAHNMFGKHWKQTNAFLTARVLRKVRRSKNKEQTWELIVNYDKSKYKKNAQYLYDRAKDPEAIKEQLKSQAAAARAADEAKAAGAAATPVVAASATAESQPAEEPSPQNSDKPATPLVDPTTAAKKRKPKKNVVGPNPRQLRQELPPLQLLSRTTLERRLRMKTAPVRPRNPRARRLRATRSRWRDRRRSSGSMRVRTRTSREPRAQMSKIQASRRSHPPRF